MSRKLISIFYDFCDHMYVYVCICVPFPVVATLYATLSELRNLKGLLLLYFGQGVAESCCHPDEGLRQCACLAAFHWADFRQGLIYSRYFTNCFNSLTIEQYSITDWLLGNKLTSVNRAVRYDDIYRMDEIKSLSFYIMFYHLFRGVAKYIVYGNTFS